MAITKAGHRKNEVIPKKSATKGGASVAEILNAPADGVVSALHVPNEPRRTLGKRSDKDFVQMNLYVRGEIRDEAKARALKEKTDLSDVVGGLLQKWIKGEVKIG
jgi:hypothetical protein